MAEGGDARHAKVMLFHCQTEKQPWRALNWIVRAEFSTMAAAVQERKSIESPEDRLYAS
jgi:hypothetical protein